MPLDSSSARPASSPARRHAVVPEDASAQEYDLKLYYAGKSSEGVRLKAGPRALAESRRCSSGWPAARSRSPTPLPIEFSEASPGDIRPSEAMHG